MHTRLLAVFVALSLTACATSPRQRLYNGLIEHARGEVEVAMQAGLKPDDLDPYGVPFLVTAARVGDVGGVNALLKAGANINIRNASDGWTALMTAAQLDQVDVVKALLAAGANVHVMDNHGWVARTLAREARGRHMAEIDSALEHAGSLETIAP